MSNLHNCIRQKNRIPVGREIDLPRNNGISDNLQNETKYGIFSGSYFPVLGVNMEIRGVSLRI